jgi:hypothetical protein
MRVAERMPRHKDAPTATPERMEGLLTTDAVMAFIQRNAVFFYGQQTSERRRVILTSSVRLDSAPANRLTRRDGGPRAGSLL